MKDYLKLMLFGIIAVFAELAIVRTFSTTISGASYYANMILLATIFSYLIGFSKPSLAKYFPITTLFILIIYLVAIYFGQFHLIQTISDEFIWTAIAQSMKQKSNLDIHLVVFCLMLSAIPFMFLIGAKVSSIFNVLVNSKKAYLLLSLGCFMGGSLFFLQNQFVSSLTSLYMILSGLICVAILFEDMKNVFKIMFCSVLILLVSFAMSYSDKFLWSPYQKISLSSPGGGIYNVFSNDTYILNISAKPSNTFDIHQVPFEAALKKTDEVLILGSGGGTADVRQALMRGSKHVTAVEIDPAFVDLGKAIDTYKTYYSDRVSLVIDDARNYLNKTDQTFDFIYFPFLDSQVTVTNSNRFRLDSFLYTREGLKQAYDKLNENGVLFINFCSPTPWLKLRFFNILYSIDSNARAYYKSNSGTEMLYVLSKGRNVSINKDAYDLDLTNDFKRVPSLTIPTDDWPFLYNMEKNIPSDYLKLLIMTFLLFLTLISFVSPIRSSNFKYRLFAVNIYAFFSGAAFFFLQIRTISIYIPVFGATYKSQSVVIVATILASLIGSLLSYRFDNRISIKIVWSLLFISLINIFLAQYYFPPMATGSFMLKLIHFGNYLMPVLIAGYIYLHYLSGYSPAEVLNIQKYNLLGGVLGGLLEPTVVYFGFSVSLLLACVFYLLCFLPILSLFISNRKALS
ncbi:MAG: hypothetical protein M0P16_03700 [Syntrophales bacterium]|nr:hypothetical protein [Syntrophales bacterium]